MYQYSLPEKEREEYKVCKIKGSNADIEIEGTVTLISIEGNNNIIRISGLISKLILQGTNNKLKGENSHCKVKNIQVNGENNSIEGISCNRAITNGTIIRDRIPKHPLAAFQFSYASSQPTQELRVNPLQRNHRAYYPIRAQPSGQILNIANRNTSQQARRPSFIRQTQTEIIRATEASIEIAEAPIEIEEPNITLSDLDNNDDENEDVNKEEEKERKREVISNIPLKRYSIKGGTDNCTICFETLRRKEFVRRLGCSHLFHKKCIDQWLMEKLECPMCRIPCNRQQ